MRMRQVFYTQRAVLSIKEHDREAGTDSPVSSNHIWLDHFKGLEQEWMLPLILQQEEAMLGIVKNIQANEVMDEDRARIIAANILVAATLGLQYRLAPESQEQMVFSMVMEGPWDTFRNFVKRTIVAEYSLQAWKLRYALLCMGTTCVLGLLVLLK